MKLGETRWHTSDAECPSPDVGIELQLAGDRQLWAGEITRKRWEDAGGEALGLGSDNGWWIILYEGEATTVIGKCLDPGDARELIDIIAASIRSAMARH
ncbi:hypothetical protein EOA24_00750 [Mesorhizobium sp. M2A.F.Ca.ET.039.01.1.1]|nr:hypothetical protein EOA24_00750 [Mesorhizobium sp. M2A.F.Ca.ET.039.01.1.1]